MMKTVQILLSSYNGEKYISRQIDSILRQKDVEIHLLIRDDGSTDGTRAIIKEYEKKYPANVEVILGENMGWKKSFFTLLHLPGNQIFVSSYIMYLHHFRSFCRIIFHW